MQCGICSMISFATVNSCLQQINIEVRQTGKIAKNAFKKYVYFSDKHCSTLFNPYLDLIPHLQWHGSQYLAL